MKLVGSEISRPEGLQEQKWELYDLKKDRTEQHDLAALHPERVKEMSAKWAEWADRANVYPKAFRHRTTGKKNPKK